MHHSRPLLDRLPRVTQAEMPVPKRPGAVRRFLGHHPWWVDALIAGAYLLIVSAAIGSESSVWISDPGAAPGTISGETVQMGIMNERYLLGLFGIFLSAAALLFRRHRPVAVLVSTAVGSVLLALAGRVEPVAIAFALYAIAAYRSSRAGWFGFAIAASIGAFLTAAAQAVHGSDSLVSPLSVALTILVSLTLLFATLIGANVGTGRRYVAALRDRAERLERDRDQRAQIAAASERARLAREMHDIVSHSLSVMITVAQGAAATAEPVSTVASQAMTRVATTGRDALTEMRRMLGVLRDELSTEPVTGPQPGLGDVGQLLETFRAASLPVRYTSSGTPTTDAGVQLAIFRTVQESLTNTLRHAHHPTEVSVTIRFSPDRVMLTITDNGGPSTATPVPGHGLLGMQQRVALFDGTFHSGPRPTTGWRVHAELKTGPSHDS